MTNMPFNEPYDNTTQFEDNNRTSMILLGLFILFVTGAFITWLFTKPDTSPPNEVATTEYVAPPKTTQNTNDPKNTGVYGFFYQMFAGIENGLDDSPHNINNIEQIDQMNIKGGIQSALADDNIIKNPSNVDNESSNDKIEKTIIEETTNAGSMINKTVYDSDGNEIGTIDTLIKENNNPENIQFTLNENLAKADATKFSLPYEALNIVKTPQGFAVQLTNKQTSALAAQYFKTTE